MDEWLSTEGLHPAEENFIKELRKAAENSPSKFYVTASFYWHSMPDFIMSAINKARTQGKCRCWPD